MRRLPLGGAATTFDRIVCGPERLNSPTVLESEVGLSSEKVEPQGHEQRLKSGRSRTNCGRQEALFVRVGRPKASIGHPNKARQATQANPRASRSKCAWVARSSSRGAAWLPRSGPETRGRVQIGSPRGRLAGSVYIFAQTASKSSADVAQARVKLNSGSGPARCTEWARQTRPRRRDPTIRRGRGSTVQNLWCLLPA